MALYQKVAYLKPGASQFVTPKSTGGGTLGTPLFRGPGEWTYNTYDGPGIYETLDQGLIGLLAFDPDSPWGLYRDVGHRVITKADGTMDPEPFFQAMAHLCFYGTKDESKSHSQMLNTARSRALEMRCGPVTAFTRQCAHSVGITTRQVHMINVTTPNFYDDGHISVEYQDGSDWVFVDVPNDILFKNQTGDMLNLGEIVSAGVANCETQVLAPNRVGSISYPDVSATFYEMFLGNHEALLEWCSRIYEVPGIAEEVNGLPTGKIEWGVPDHLSSYASTIENYPGVPAGLWTTLPWADWVQKHY